MRTDTENQGSGCPSDEIGAYIDCELTPSEELELEAHLAECPVCLTEFNSQKGLLSVLDSALLPNSEEIPVPENFARAVSVRATSNVSGIRKPVETHRAMVIWSLLLVVATAGLAFVPGVGGVPIEKFGFQVVAVSGIVIHSLFDFGTGIGIVLRCFGQSVFHGSELVLALSVTVFVIAAAALSKMVRRYHRVL